MSDPKTRTTVVLDEDLMTHFKIQFTIKKMKLQDALTEAVKLWCRENGAPYEPVTIGDDHDRSKAPT